MKVAWLADAGNGDGSLGGAELTVREFRAAAPVEVVEVAPDQLDAVIIYALVDPRDDVVRYVGKTTWTPARRLTGHIAEAKLKPYTRKSKWLNELNRAGIKPRVVELERVPEAGWEMAERRWIATHATTVTNVTAGGEAGGAGAATAKGQACAGAKLTEVDVRTICERYAVGGVTQQTLADEHGVTVGLVAQIVRGKVWKHVDRPVIVRERGAPGVTRRHPKGLAAGEKNGNSRLTVHTVQAIRRAYNAGARQVVLAAEHGVDQTTISLIVCRKVWGHV